MSYSYKVNIFLDFGFVFYPYAKGLHVNDPKRQWQEVSVLGWCLSSVANYPDFGPSWPGHISCLYVWCYTLYMCVCLYLCLCVWIYFPYMATYDNINWKIPIPYIVPSSENCNCKTYIIIRCDFDLGASSWDSFIWLNGHLKEFSKQTMIFR